MDFWVFRVQVVRVDSKVVCFLGLQSTSGDLLTLGDPIAFVGTTISVPQSMGYWWTQDFDI